MDQQPQCDKVAYDNQAMARQAIQGIHRAGKGGKNKPSHSYQCRHCQKWHISSNDKKGMKSDKKFITLAPVKLKRHTKSEMQRIQKRFK